MKKIYNTPSVKVVILNASPILTGSNDPEIDNTPIPSEEVGVKKYNYRFDLVDEDFE